jgi:ABC-type multidrug transport system fused ATPase/permease subunit
MNIFKFRRGVWRVFWPFIRPYSWKIGLALVILLLDTLADLASPWPIKLIFDNVLLGKHLHQPWSLIIPQALAQNHLYLFLYRALRYVAPPRADQCWRYLHGYASAGNRRAARHLPFALRTLRPSPATHPGFL